MKRKRVRVVLGAFVAAGFLAAIGTTAIVIANSQAGAEQDPGAPGGAPSALSAPGIIEADSAPSFDPEAGLEWLIEKYGPTFIPRQRALGEIPSSFYLEIESHPSFAGVYIDNDAGTILVIRATDNLDYFEAMADRYRGAERIIVVRKAEYTMAELQAWQARGGADMVALREQGIAIAMIEADPVTNRLIFRVVDLTEAKAALLVERYGGPALVVVEPGVEQRWD